MGKNKIVGQGVSVGVGRGLAVRVNYDGDLEIPKKFTKQPVVLVVDNLKREIYKYLSKDTCAVVSSYGSIGCHGAGIMRELKIPCVVKCNSQLLDNLIGNYIEVDGKEGIIDLSSEKVKRNLEHNSDKKNKIGKTIIPEKLLNVMLNKEFNNKIQISEETECYRPKRKYQKLRFDMLKKGWEENPEFLFGLNKCHLELSNENVISIKRGPVLSDIRKFILNNIEWFFQITKRRQEKISKWKQDLIRFQDDVNSINPDVLRKVIQDLIEIYTGLLRFIYMTQFVADDLIEEWKELVKNFSETPDSMLSLLKSEYTKQAVIKDNYPVKSTFWSIPSNDPYIWEGEVIFDITTPDEEQALRAILLKSIKLGSDIIITYCRYRLVVPIVYQMAEEHYFVSSSVCSFLNRAIDSASKLIYGENQSTEYRSQIYSSSLENLLKKL